MTFVNIGAGCTKPGDTHIYIGTSGWVSTFMNRQAVDINAMITGVLSARKGFFNYYAELETAGKCFEWVAYHLALDEVGVYMNHTKVTDLEKKWLSLYDFLSEEVDKLRAEIIELGNYKDEVDAQNKKEIDGYKEEISSLRTQLKVKESGYDKLSNESSKTIADFRKLPNT